MSVVTEAKDSYRGLRRAIGILGLLLPFVCVLGGWVFAATPILPSISNYYYSNMRDVFVGILAAVCLFLVTYRGYSRVDTVVTSITGSVGFLVPFFPMKSPIEANSLVGIFNLPSTTTQVVHYLSAILFFALLAVNSMFLFTRSNVSKEKRTPGKRKRNRVYIVCGILIIATLVLTAILKAVLGDNYGKFDITLIAETIMLLAFGFSWLTKGETLFRD